MPKILFITAFPPNSKTAGQNYTRLLLEDLKSDYEIEVCYWAFPNHTVELSEDIAVTEMPMIPSLCNPMLIRYFPLFSKRFSYKTLAVLQDKANNADIVYFDFSQTFIFSRFINHPFKIGMSHDVIAQKYFRNQRFKLFSKWILRSEGHLIKSINHLFTFSIKDRKLLQNYYNVQSTVVPFFIDDKIQKLDLQNIRLEDYFVMYGAWNRSENVESLKWVMANYFENIPPIKIIGGGLSQQIQEALVEYPMIEYLGFVDNPYSIIAKSKALIAPLFHGAGVKVKAIESLALGTPIIGNDITFEGLPALTSNALIDVTTQSVFKLALYKLSGVDINTKQNIRNDFKVSYCGTPFKMHLKRILNA